MYVCLFVILAMMKTQLGSNVNATDVPCLRLALISCRRLTWSRPCSCEPNMNSRNMIIISNLELLSMCKMWTLVERIINEQNWKKYTNWEFWKRYCPYDLFTIFLKLPRTITKWTNVSGFQPSGNAMKVECVITDSPSNGAFVVCAGPWVSLAFYTKVHDVVSADCTVVDFDVPGPHSYRGPFFNLKTLRALTLTCIHRLLGRRDQSSFVFHNPNFLLTFFF